MNSAEIKTIQSRIESVKSDRARAEGQQQAILENWKTTYGISTLEEAEELRATLQQRVERLDDRINEAGAELRALVGAL